LSKTIWRQLTKHYSARTRRWLNYRSDIEVSTPVES